MTVACMMEETGENKPVREETGLVRTIGARSVGREGEALTLL